MRSRKTFTSLWPLTAVSMRGQQSISHSANSRRRMLPIRRWTTRGGGDTRMMRCEKSASFVTITRSFSFACCQRAESDIRSPRLEAWTTGRDVLKPETAGRFSSKRNPVMTPDRASIGYASVAPRGRGKRVPGGGLTLETPAAPRRLNHLQPTCREQRPRQCACRERLDDRCRHRNALQSHPYSLVQSYSIHD